MTGAIAADATLRLCIVQHDGVAAGIVGTLALNLAVAAAVAGARATLPADLLPPMLLAAAASSALPAAAHAGPSARALPLVDVRGDGTAWLSSRAPSPARGAAGAVEISIVDRDGREGVDARTVQLLPVTGDAQLARIVGAQRGAVPLPRIVLPRMLSRDTDRWSLVDRAVELAGDALCLTTVPFGRRDRTTLYAPATRAARAYAALLAELGGAAS